MRLRAALLPPSAVQDDLAAVVASVPNGREQLVAVPATMLHLDLAVFGNVTSGDAVKLRETLEREVAQWPPMRFRFHGGAALEPVGDDSAWARLEGDLEQLTHISDVIARVAKRLGFMVDRRLSRSLVRVGRITPATTADYLQRVIDRLDEHSSPEWSCDSLVLLRMVDVAGAPPTFEAEAQLMLKGSDPL